MSSYKDCESGAIRYNNFEGVEHKLNSPGSTGT